MMNLTDYIEWCISHNQPAETCTRCEYEKTPLTPERFLQDRIIELKHQMIDLGIEWARFEAILDSQWEILELHKKFPVYVQEKEPEIRVTPSLENLSDIAYKIHHKMMWLEREAYVKAFGKIPPTTTMLQKMLEGFSDHPDFNEEWLS